LNRSFYLLTYLLTAWTTKTRRRLLMMTTGQRVEASRLEVPKTLGIETPKALRKGGGWEGCFPPQPTRRLGKVSQWSRKSIWVKNASAGNVFHHFMQERRVENVARAVYSPACVAGTGAFLPVAPVESAPDKLITSSHRHVWDIPIGTFHFFWALHFQIGYRTFPTLDFSYLFHTISVN